jgi:hypothetical protein
MGLKLDVSGALGVPRPADLPDCVTHGSQDFKTSRPRLLPRIQLEERQTPLPYFSAVSLCQPKFKRQVRVWDTNEREMIREVPIYLLYVIEKQTKRKQT